jgi:ABC-type transport system involved in multi-copper enzyme maturation permease subunit
MSTSTRSLPRAAHAGPLAARVIQARAILLDSLRLLLSRKLFWLSLLLSVLAAFILFGTYSFNTQGLRVLWFSTIENKLLAQGTEGSRQFVAYMFNSIYVGFWLSWGAIILAVLSTASILPEFLSSGSIELSLSKPISRLALLFWRVLGALLFVLLQTAVGVGLAYLLMGLKFNLWLHESLWAIPLITLQFFYLFAVSALLAVLTRSTLVCVIGTILFWLAIFVVQFASNQVTRAASESSRLIEIQTKRIARAQAAADAESRGPSASEQRTIDNAQRQIDEVKGIADATATWAGRLDSVELFVPKTGDIQKIIANVAKAPVPNEVFSLFGASRMRPPNMDDQEFDDLMAAGTEGQRATRRVKVAQSIATSAAFSLAALTLAAFLFRRRDF